MSAEDDGVDYGLTLTLDAITTQNVDDSISIHSYDLKYTPDDITSLERFELIAEGLGEDVDLVKEINLNGNSITSLLELAGSELNAIGEPRFPHVCNLSICI